jgi:hypothetical protein
MAQWNQWQQPQYAQPPQHPPVQPHAAPSPHYPPPPPAPPKRGGWIVALIASCALLAVLVVAIIVVTAVRRSVDERPAAGGASTTPAGPVDTCLVGRWTLTEYQSDIPLNDTDLGKRANLGTVRFSGSGRKWTINADGSAKEDNSATVFAGRASDGRKVEAVFSGTAAWALKTAEGKIHYSGGESTSSVTIKVDGTVAGRIDLQPNQDPRPYTCVGDIWRMTTPGDPNAFATYRRQT